VYRIHHISYCAIKGLELLTNKRVYWAIQRHSLPQHVLRFHRRMYCLASKDYVIFNLFYLVQEGLFASTVYRKWAFSNFPT